MPSKILIVEDDHDIAELMEYNFRKEGYATETRPTAEGAVEAAEGFGPDIMMLDIMLPGGNGLDLLQKIRSSEKLKEVGVIMVTAKGEESDIEKGLNLGADDYVIKPFSPKELVARIRAVLRRSNQSSNQNIEGDSVRIDHTAHRVFIDSKEIIMTASEFKLLCMFKDNNGKVLTRDFLVSGLVGDGTHIIERNIDVHVRSLRKKLSGYSKCLETVRSFGYRWQE